MLKIKVSVNGKDKILFVKEIFVSSYNSGKAEYLLTCEDNRRYSGTEYFNSLPEEHDMEMLLNFEEVK